jgi:hypothetical protein
VGLVRRPFDAVLLGDAIQKQPELWLDAQLRARIGTFCSGILRGIKSRE